MKDTPSHHDDLALLIRIQEGDSQAFEVLYKSHWKYVINCAYKRTQDLEVSKDICQEIFSHLWQHLQTQPSMHIQNLKGYLYIAVRNQVFKWMDSQARLTPLQEVLAILDDHQNSPEATFLYNELICSYGYLTSTLPAQQQIIFKLQFEEGLNTAAIAERLQITEKTVRNQIARAVHKLKSQLLIYYLLLLLTIQH